MAKKQTRNRTLTYRRAMWSAGRHRLEQLLREASLARTTTRERTFPYYEGVIEGLDVNSPARGLWMHLTAYVPGQPTSIVPEPSRSQSDAPSQHNAPDSYHFSSGDLFAYVRGNDVLLCASGAREGAFLTFVEKMLQTSGKEALVSLYSIEPVADVNKAALIREEGVKKVLLGATLYEATMEYETRRGSLKKTLMKSLADNLLAFIASDARYNVNPEDYENLSVRLELSFDARKPVTAQAISQLERAARNVVDQEDDDGFKIVTRKGKTLTAEQIRVNSTIDLPAFGNSVSRDAAYRALADFHGQLQNSGALAQ